MSGASRAIVLLSGGLDSATCLLIARGEADEVFALSFDYGQRHRVEIERARLLARALRRGGPPRRSSRRARAGRLRPDRPVARRFPATLSAHDAIPVTYVPARNTLFLAHAVAWGETIGAGDIYIGANALDYSGYPGLPPGVPRGVRAHGQPRDEGRRRRRTHLPNPRPPAAPDQGGDRRPSGRARVGFFTDVVVLRPDADGSAVRCL